MNMTGRFAVCGGLLLALVSGSAIQTPAQVTFTLNDEAPFSATPKSEREFRAFQNIQRETDPDDKLRLANDFLSDYTDSEFRHLVMRFRFEVQYDAGDWEATVAGIQEGLAAEEAFREGKLALITNPEELDDWPAFQLDMANQKMIYYQSLAEGYQALGDLDNALTYAEMTLDAQDEAWDLYASQSDPSTPEYQGALERQNANREFVLRTIYSIYDDRDDVPNMLKAARDVLEVSPGDLEMLMRVAQIMSVEVPDDPTAKKAHLEEAEGYASDAITALKEWVVSDASANVGQTQKDGLVAQAYSNLGMIYFQTPDYARAAEAFASAAEALPTNAALHYQLGVAYNNSQNIEAAASSLARAVYLGFDQGRPALESVYQAMHGGSLDGLDEFVETEGKQVSSQ